MRKPKNSAPFVPDPEQMKHIPAISGNTINGLGEMDARNPSVVYWATDMGQIAHGDLQGYFYQQSAKEPAFTAVRADRVKATAFELPDVAKTQAQKTPAEWTAALDNFVDTALCEKIGVTLMDPRWVYEGHVVTQSHVIVIGVQHDYDQISTAPEKNAGLEVVTQYTRAAVAAKKVAAWLRENGWGAAPVTGPLTGELTLIPPALAAGFGELGKHGSAITPEFGSSFRLAAVLTDAPFEPTPAQSHGIDAFCQNCRICEEACPPQAISSSKQMVRGERRWYVDFDKCIPFFNEHHGCAICIAVCPWSRPGVGLNLAAKLAKRAERISEDIRS